MGSMRALVTGGAGFLGSHLCDALLGEGYSVIAADNLLTGRKANIAHLGRDSRFEFLEQDVCDPIRCGEVDYVFHFASPASPVDYAAHGLATLKVFGRAKLIPWNFTICATRGGTRPGRTEYGRRRAVDGGKGCGLQAARP